MRTALLVALLLVGPAAAADPAPPDGRWKLRLPQGDDGITFLLNFTKADGKWVGDFLGSDAKLRAEPAFGKLEVEPPVVRFTLLFGPREFLAFDGVLAPDGSKLAGSLSQFGGPLTLTELRPSKLKKLDDPADLAREDLTQLDPGPGLFAAGFAVLGQAAAKKLPADEVRQTVDKLVKAAAGYGPAWERATAVKVAGTLAAQPGFADVALAQARRAERMLTDTTPAAVQLTTQAVLAMSLSAAGKSAEAAKVEARVEKLEAKEYAEHLKAGPGFVPPPAGIRDAKADRVSLVEVFTGAECPPCVAVDLATDAVSAVFPPTAVLVLNYHFHVPAADPLTSPDGLDRLAQYGDRVRGAPAVFLDGKPGPDGGGPAAAGKAKHAELRQLLDPALAAPAGATVTLKAAPAAKGFTAAAAVKLAGRPAKPVVRFALVEGVVRYQGGNGVKFHQNVVRAMPGGAAGFPVPAAGGNQAVTFDPAEVRVKLAAYLAEYAKAEGPFPRPDRPLALTNLKLVAFVTDDATGEVLQAAAVVLDPAK